MRRRDDSDLARVRAQHVDYGSTADIMECMCASADALNMTPRGVLSIVVEYTRPRIKDRVVVFAVHSMCVSSALLDSYDGGNIGAIADMRWTETMHGCLRHGHAQVATSTCVYISGGTDANGWDVFSAACRYDIGTNQCAGAAARHNAGAGPATPWP